jgi:hypothetical protein
MYENAEEWDKDVPADLIPAVKHLRKSFEMSHWKCFMVTEQVCLWCLHKNVLVDDLEEYVAAFQQLKLIVGAVATHSFLKLFAQKTPPATFRAFFDIYLEGVCTEALRTFHQLIEIGRANEPRLHVTHLEWAIEQAKHLVRSQRHMIAIWVRNVCDKRVDDPSETLEERLYWTNWQAPSLLTMKPALNAPYDSRKNWERNTASESSELLTVFADRYVRRLEMKVKDAAGEEAVRLAAEPKSPAQTASVTSSIQPDPESDDGIRSRLWRQVMSAKPGATMSTVQAATVLGVSAKTVSRRVSNGLLAGGPKRGRVTCESLQRRLPKAPPDEKLS